MTEEAGSPETLAPGREIGTESIEAGVIAGRTGPDDHVHGGDPPLNLAAPQLAQPPLETIAGHRALAVSWDNQPQSRKAQIVGDPPNVEVPLPTAPTGSTDPLQIGTPGQPA